MHYEHRKISGYLTLYSFGKLQYTARSFWKAFGVQIQYVSRTVSLRYDNVLVCVPTPRGSLACTIEKMRPEKYTTIKGIKIILLV